MTTRYTAYGLTIDSDLPCPRLRRGVGTPDVVIQFGPVPRALKNPTTQRVFYESTNDCCLLKLERVAGARFLVQRGQRVLIQRTGGGSDDLLQLYLLSSCLASVLYQRGIVPLHGNAIATERGAVVIAGDSGAGKSTLSLALLRRGYRVLTDDICPITLAARQPPMVQPGIPHLKLWADTLEQLGEATDLPRVRPELEKYNLPLNGAFCEKPLALQAIYVLQRSHEDRLTLTPATGMHKLNLLQLQLFNNDKRERGGDPETWIPRIAAIANRVHAHNVQRPSRGFRVEELADLVEGDFSRA